MTPAIATLRQLIITLPAIEIPPEQHVACLQNRNIGLTKHLSPQLNLILNPGYKTEQTVLHIIQTN